LKEKAKIPLLTIIIAALLLSSSASVTSVIAQEEVPREETVIISSAWGPPPGWSPLLPSQSYGYELMYPKLYLYTPFSDEWIPYAAESYQWIDRYTLQVKIRDEAEWWDGNPVTAADYKYSLELGQKYVVAMYTPLWDYIESVEVIDEKTVQIATTDEKLNYFQLFGVLNGPVILPKHIWEDLETEYGDDLPSEFRNDVPDEIVGAGPYRLMSWSEQVYYYERVDDWWGVDIFGLPDPKYIAHPDMKDNMAAALAFEAGDLDMMTHFTPEIWEMWVDKGLARRTYYDHPPYYVGGGVTFLWINMDREPLDDATVRRAIAHVIPIDDMIELAYFNYGTKAVAVPIIHTSAAVALIDEDLVDQYGWEYDMDTAKQILDDAGIVDTTGDDIREMPDGTPLSGFVIQVPYGWTDWMMMCDMIATNLGEIGIECTTEFPDFSVWWARLSEKNWDFVLGWADASPGYSHPWNSFRSTMDNRLSHPSGNWENYNNPDVQALIDAIPKESDAEVLKDIYSQLQEMWLTDIPGIPTFYGATWYEYSEDYWTGWPNDENGFWFAAHYGAVEGLLPTLFNLVPAGETPSQPSWITETKFSTSKILEDLTEAPVHGFITVTTTTTVTSLTTSVVTTTTERVVPTMDVTIVAGAGIVALIAGIVVGWLVGSRKS